jgi:deoxynucleoside triphosphate triphosphohydrolase SAMHD1
MVYIYDNIHGFIEFTSLEKKFLDNKWVKRLKRIKQLGLLDHVWPCASHSRFEHSLGVSYLAEKYINYLKSNSKNYKINDSDKLNIKLAGLFHDLGHGPFSHLFDNIVLKKCCNINNKNIIHEIRSRNIVEYIFNDINLPSNYSSAYMIDSIKEMIEPVSINSKSVKYNIVNNTINSIDVDKFDYLLRDPKHIGLDYSFNYNRIFLKSKIINDEIVYDDSISNDILDLYLTRYKFHKEIYNHKTAKIIETMLADSLIIYNNFESFDSLINSEEFINLDDSIYSKILLSKNKDLLKCKNIIKRIENRNLYKQIWSGKLDDFDLNDFSDYRESDLRIINMKFDLCNKNKFPLEKVKFYDKKNENIKFISNNNLNKLYPNKYEENYLLVCSSKLN